MRRALLRARRRGRSCSPAAAAATRARRRRARAPARGEGGTLEWAIPERAIELDPLFADNDSERLISRQIHEPLVERLKRPFDESGAFAGLAASVRPSSDFRVWELRLRPGIRFQDGTPLSAQAVLANVERWQAEPAAERPAAAAGAVRRHAEAGPGQVHPRPPRPQPRREACAAAPRHRRAGDARPARSAGGAAFTASGSGTGPFELRERSAQSACCWRETPAWWGARRGLGPALDQIEFTVLPGTARQGRGAHRGHRAGRRRAGPRRRDGDAGRIRC